MIDPAASRGNVFLSGSFRAISTPGIIMAAGAAGFGALARDSGLSAAQALTVMGLFFGLPGQVVVADNIARETAFLVGALAVTLTAVRFLPLTVSLLPLLRDDDEDGARLRWWHVLAVHFVTVTAWLEAIRHLPDLPPRLRLLHFLGLGVGLLSMTLIGTLVGYHFVGVVPPVVGAVLLFVLPIYFLLSIIGAAKLLSDKLAVVLGCALGPAMYFVVPGLDLLLAGVLAGTIAFFIGQFAKRDKASHG